jgi:hypothetical protein
MVWYLLSFSSSSFSSIAAAACATGWGFVLAILAMMVAAFVEMYRLSHAPSAGGYDDQSAQDNITPCQNIDDYDPNQYQEWWQGGDADEPLHCSQSCDDTYYIGKTQYLNSSCIDCDDIPQMSNISVMWQVSKS